MRIYRRHVHCKKVDGLTVDNVLCKVLRPWHLTANGKYFCFHNMTFTVPELTSKEKGFIMLSVPDSPTELPVAEWND